MDRHSIKVHNWEQIQRVLNILETQSEPPYSTAYRYLSQDIIPDEIKFLKETSETTKGSDSDKN